MPYVFLSTKWYRVDIGVLIEPLSCTQETGRSKRLPGDESQYDHALGSWVAVVYICVCSFVSVTRGGKLHCEYSVAPANDLRRGDQAAD